MAMNAIYLAESIVHAHIEVKTVWFSEPVRYMEAKDVLALAEFVRQEMAKQEAAKEPTTQEAWEAEARLLAKEAVSSWCLILVSPIGETFVTDGSRMVILNIVAPPFDYDWRTYGLFPDDSPND